MASIPIPVTLRKTLAPRNAHYRGTHGQGVAHDRSGQANDSYIARARVGRRAGGRRAGQGRAFTAQGVARVPRMLSHRPGVAGLRCGAKMAAWPDGRTDWREERRAGTRRRRAEGVGWRPRAGGRAGRAV